MAFFWIRWLIYGVMVTGLLTSLGSSGMTEASLYWLVGGIAVMQLSHPAERMVVRWQERKVIRDYLSMDPVIRDELVGKIWMSRTRRELATRLAAEAAVTTEAGIERFPFPRMDTRQTVQLFWGLVPVAAVLLGSAAGLLRLGIGLRLTLIAAGMILVAILILLRRRERHLRTVIEISPFNITEVAPNGAGRRITFNAPLELRNRPRLGRIELRLSGTSDFIALDYDRVGFVRALNRVLDYGGFRASLAPEAPPEDAPADR